MKAPLKPSRSSKLSWFLVNDLNRFSPKLADLKDPLRALCKKDVVFAWEISQQEAFEAIKKEITRVPVQAYRYVEKSKTSVIQSDASKKGLGTVSKSSA